MKTICFIIFLTFAFSFSHATEYIVEARGTTIPTDIYVPDTVYAEVGDTITWIWVDGVHTTESTDIPAGASSWASNLNNSTTTFSYVVTEEGRYDYTCHKSSPHGMDGTIIVSEKTPTGIAVTGQEPVSTAYPNPFSDRIAIDAVQADFIYLYNIAGQKVKSVPVHNGQGEVEIDAAFLDKGIYFYSITHEGVIVRTGKVVKN